MDDLEAELGVTPPAAREVSAELVPAARPKPPGRGKNSRTGPHLLSATTRKRDKSFSQVQLLGRDRKYVYGRFSDREKKLIAILLKTGNQTQAAEEIGVHRTTVARFVKRPFVAAYLEQMRQRASGAADLTVDKISRIINAAADGSEDITPQQLQAAQIASKLLVPRAGTNITINQQTNYNGPSPFADLGQAAMLDELKRNLLEMGAGPDAK